MDKEKLSYAFYLMEQGVSITEASEKTGISRMTLYRKMQR
ncbi:helix-turn-helix domain-containing protein [Bacillus thuringiensis]